MTGSVEVSGDDVLEIKQKIEEMKGDLQRFMAQVSQSQLELMVASARKDMAGALAGHVAVEMEEGLDSRMVKRCDLRAQCRLQFSNFLNENARMIGRDAVPETEIEKSRQALADLRKCGPYDRCDTCFSGVRELLEKEIGLMRALQARGRGTADRTDVLALPEAEVVDEILDPVSNRLRLQMLKSLYTGTRTFSELSAITGLRGGNLLFHLQKLLDSGMITQRYSGSDYILTGKGRKVLMAISDVSGLLREKPESPDSTPVRLSTP